MAGLPGGGRGPSGVPKFVSAPATKPVGDSTTYIARPPTFVPTWQRYRTENLGSVQGTPLTLKPVVAVAAPFSQDDWQNPRGAWQQRNYVNWADWYSIQVIPFTSQGGNWDNPRGPTARHAGYQGWIDYSTSPAGVTADTTHILRAPVYTPRWSPYRIETLGFVQGTTLTLRPPGVVINPPIRLYDWPNPRGWPRPHVGFVTGETLKQPPPPTRTSDCLLLLEDSSGNLILEDFLGLLALELCGPFVTYDLALPPRALGPRQDWVQNAYAARNAVVVAAKPFLQTEWPNPRGPVSAHYGFAYGTNLGLLRPDVRPFAQDDWPNPRGAQRGQDLATGTNLGLLRPDVRPEVNYDWPNPRAALRGPADYIVNTNLGLLRPDVNPFAQRDWPNPRGALRPVVDFIGILTLATPPVPVPFAQTDWPNPFGPLRSINLLTWVNGVVGSAPVAPANPFTPLDWANPRGAFGVHVGWTASTQLGLLRPDVNPFIPRDFANPKAPQRGVDLYGWIAALTALVIPPPPPPTFPPNGQYNWPNPAGPVRGIDLWGWSQPVTALNLPPTIIPPPEVLQPGGRGVPHTFSRKKWRELQMLIAAEMAAVAKAEELTKRGKREALLQAARAAATAVDAAEAEGENKRLDKLLVRNALTLRAAIRAASEVKLLRETASAIEQSRAIVQRQQDEEDEMINLLMLS